MRSILLLACGSLVLTFCPQTYADENDDTFKWPEKDERRDPFTFIAKAPRITDQPPLLLPGPKQDLSRQVAEAESHLLALEPQRAFIICDCALKEARQAAAENSEHAQRLFCIRRAAERMLQRQQAEAAFAALDLRITGVVCQGRKSVAIINGRHVNQGDAVAVSETESLIVEEIGRDRITFVFRGFRFAREYRTADERR